MRVVSLPSHRRAPTSQLLLELTVRVTRSLDLREVLDETLAALRGLLSLEGGTIRLIEDEALASAATDAPISWEHRTVRIAIEGSGFLQIDSPDAFSSEDRALVSALQPAISAAVRNALAYRRQREAVEELHEADRMKRDFLSLISHELKTPLTSIVGFAETLSHYAHELRPEVVEQLSERIGSASRRLDRLIGDLLDLSRIDRRGLEVDPRPVEIEPIVRQVIAETASLRHDIEVELEPGLPRVVGDPDRLNQVLANLVNNAVKFAPAASRIRIVAEREGERVAIRVADEGPGIREDLRERIFEPFVQAEEPATRQRGGMGIGLYLVRHIVQALGGEASVASEVGRGSTFTVLLPAVYS